MKTFVTEPKATSMYALKQTHGDGQHHARAAPHMPTHDEIRSGHTKFTSRRDVGKANVKEIGSRLKMICAVNENLNLCSIN